jgi:hypothetical protein
MFPSALHGWEISAVSKRGHEGRLSHYRAGQQTEEE